jgi:Fe-S oxidoreductase
MSTLTAERGLDTLKEMIDAPAAAFFSSCTHCGLCAEACLFYTETGDPRYTPIHKLEPMRRTWFREFTLLGRIGARLGLLKPVGDADLKAWETLVYDSCTMCGRCSLVCPVGNDITYMVRRMRECMVASGHAPEELMGAAERALTYNSPMGNLLPALMADIRNAERDTGIPIHLDKPGAEYMVILSAQETAEYPEIIGAMAKIFKHAGIDWTICSDGFEATNVGLQIGSGDIARRLVARLVEAAERLGVKYVVSPECGHAYQALRWEGPNLIGRQYKFEVIHIIELLDKLRLQGKLKTEGRHKAKVTFHDPCQLSRRGGILGEPRALMKQVCDNFVEMEDPGGWNWCCGGGGGVGANERADELRLTVFRRKKRQLDDVRPDELVTMCAYCHHTLERGLEEYKMDLEVKSLTELIAEYLPDVEEEEPEPAEAAPPPPPPPSPEPEPAVAEASPAPEPKAPAKPKAAAKPRAPAKPKAATKPKAEARKAAKPKAAKTGGDEQ